MAVPTASRHGAGSPALPGPLWRPPPRQNSPDDIQIPLKPSEPSENPKSQHRQRGSLAKAIPDSTLLSPHSCPTAPDSASSIAVHSWSAFGPPPRRPEHSHPFARLRTSLSLKRPVPSAGRCRPCPVPRSPEVARVCASDAPAGPVADFARRMTPDLPKRVSRCHPPRQARASRPPMTPSVTK